MKSEIFFMEKAIDLAKLGKYSVTPNPMVGCIITEKNKILSEAYHNKAGCDHAEVIALKKLKRKVNKNMSMYVTLEPCCHTGKTGPCSDFIIDSGIKNIFVAMLDPNPKVKGKGIKKLRLNGINVQVGLCRDKAKEINKGFISRLTKKRPYVIAKQALSIDNKITNPRSKWLSGANSRKDVHFLRAISCAILVGSNTIHEDNPALDVRLNKKDFLTTDKIRNPVRIVLDSELNLNIDKYKFFRGKEKKIIFNNILDKKDMSKNIDYVKVKKDSLGLNLNLILSILAEKYDINYLMIEPGTKLLKSLIKKDILDELIIYKCPLIVGKSGLTSLSVEKKINGKKSILLESVKKISNDVRITYKFLRE